MANTTTAKQIKNAGRNGLETWAAVHVSRSKIKRQDVIDAISRVAV